MKRPAPRHVALTCALALSLGATAWVSREDEDEPVAAMSRRAAAVSPVAGDWPGPAASARTAWPAADPQIGAAWGEAHPPMAAAPTTSPPQQTNEPTEAPLAPTVPAFPYQLVGRLTDGASRAILNNAQRSTVVGVGEVVDGQWRVDAVEAGGLHLTYLPLGEAQFIPFPAA
jgi:hypothetical protein